MEYALILAFISVITISILAALGRQVTGIFSRVNTAPEHGGQSLARKATSEKQSVILSLSKDQPPVIFTVEDNRVGL